MRKEKLRVKNESKARTLLALGIHHNMRRCFVGNPEGGYVLPRVSKNCIEGHICGSRTMTMYESHDAAAQTHVFGVCAGSNIKEFGEDMVGCLEHVVINLLPAKARRMEPPSATPLRHKQTLEAEWGKEVCKQVYIVSAPSPSVVPSETE